MNIKFVKESPGPGQYDIKSKAIEGYHVIILIFIFIN